MKSLKIKKDFTLKSKSYFENDNIDDKEFEIEEIINLNEKGYIQPLTQKEIISLIEERKNKNKMFKSSETKEGE